MASPFFSGGTLKKESEIMDTIKIALKKTKFGKQNSQTPFWFTSIKSPNQPNVPYIYLSTNSVTSINLNLKTTPIEVLQEVYSGILSGDISVDKIELLMTSLGLIVAGASTKKEAVVSPLPEIKEDLTKTKEPVIEQDPVIVKAEELLQLSQAKLADEIGSGSLVDGEIPVGINDVKLLSIMLEKEPASRNRKKVIAMLEKRIELLKEERYMVITDEKETELKLVGNQIIPTETPETKE